MSTKKKDDFKDLLQEELESRITEMEAPDYEHVPRLKRGDYIGMIILAAVCIAVILVGII